MPFWAYIFEVLLSEGYLRLRLEGLIFRRTYFQEGLLSEFYSRYNIIFNYLFTEPSKQQDAILIEAVSLLF